MTAGQPLRLKRNEERRIRAGHVWVYSNEVDVASTPLTDFEPGDAVEIQDSRGGSLGVGYVNPHSLICARLVSRAGRPLDASLIRERVSRALSLREMLFPQEPHYRLVYGEGDGLPGLIVERLDDILVVQVTTAGMERVTDEVLGVLEELLHPAAIVLRNDTSARAREGLEQYVRVARGEVPDAVRIRENGVPFDVPTLGGQKTGWFFDHRMSRGRLRSYVSGARVLDVFCYLGGWGIQAAVAGAQRVVCVDSSVAALEGVGRNAALNGVSDRVETVEADAFDALQQMRERGERFDVVVLDPPAFIKRRKDLKAGQEAYERLNRLAISVVADGGMLVTASCSFHFGRDLLLRAVLRASTRAGSDTQIVEEGHQGPDHPIHPAIAETAYLNTFFARVSR
jgi:23S rRNA (cytosine1962-C5)-methyltransferase